MDDWYVLSSNVDNSSIKSGLYEYRKTSEQNNSWELNVQDLVIN